MNNIDYLYKYLSAFITLSSDEEKIIASLFKENIFKKNEFFLREGEVCHQLGFICKGVFRYYIDQDGQEQTYNFAKEGDFICNYESMIKQSFSPKHIQAIEPGEILTISYQDLQQFFKSVKDGNLFGRLHMENVYTDTIRQLVSLYTETPETRYLKFLKKYPELNQRLPQYYIASYVGVKPQSLSRIRKRLTSKAIY
jgi:CRP-like cAMP-binding protein